MYQEDSLHNAASTVDATVFALALNLAFYLRKHTWLLRISAKEKLTHCYCMQVDMDLDPTDIRARFPKFPGKDSAIEVTVNAGQMLYLPAGWFHEVTSYSIEDLSNAPISHAAGNAAAPGVVVFPQLALSLLTSK